MEAGFVKLMQLAFHFVESALVKLVELGFSFALTLPEKSAEDVADASEIAFPFSCAFV
jgi:hypothetical protein